MFKYILFDLDNTIYNYDKCNETALNFVFNKISENYEMDIIEIKTIFNSEKNKFKNSCNNTNASSHNKFIQLKKLFERLKIKLDNIDYYYGLYVSIFNNNINENLYKNIINFLDFCKINKIKMYILTNNMCREQIQKINKLNIINYFEKIYTSEEFGIEKPDSKLYYYILSDIGCNKNEIVKIGDNYINDIQATEYLNIYSFWFNDKFKINNKYLEFDNYANLLNFYEKYYCYCNEYIKLSSYLGERFDLVQAGGGNTSFKMNELMFVKSSGCNLSDITINKNYVCVDFVKIKNNLTEIFLSKEYDKSVKSNILNKKEKEILSTEMVNNSIILLKQFKPSIETTLHTLTKKYTVHIHPIQFNLISSLPNCDTILKELFTKYCLIDYFTPGIDVTIDLINKYNDESVIFMKNHGIVFTTNNTKEMYNIINETMTKLEDYYYKNITINVNIHNVNNANNIVDIIDFSKYKYVNTISYTMRIIFNMKFVSYLCEDMKINNYINNNILQNNNNIYETFFPDKVIYCGMNVININMKDLNILKNNVIEYHDKYDEIPKIFIIKNENNNINNIYFSSITIKKCQEIESVFKSHLLCYNQHNIMLKNEELKYLNNLDSEKYRKQL
jgi:HAD superfamily hydrolase (TIGR01549 family)